MDQIDGSFSAEEGIYVPAGGDRRQGHRNILGNLRIDFKLLAQDTHGALLVIENVSKGRGGPPRHVHHAQEEWFYAIDGNFVVEVGALRHHLQPGDSLFAPRGVPHVWAHVGDEVGRLLIAFQPAGAMEAFFDEMASMSGPRSKDDMQRIFQSHGMSIVGPPLADG